jgi:transcriptional regulator with XRE-family HTH domain
VARDEEDEAPPVAAVQRLADFVRSARKRKGWSQQNLAEFTQLSRDQIKALETGGSDPRCSVVLQLLPVLDCTADDLLRILYGQQGAQRIRKEGVIV